MEDFKDSGDMVRAQLRKGLESARAVMDAWLAGLWGTGERGRQLRRRNWLVKGSMSLDFFNNEAQLLLILCSELIVNGRRQSRPWREIAGMQLRRNGRVSAQKVWRFPGRQD